MENNTIGGPGNAGRVIFVRRDFFGRRIIINLGESPFGLREPGKLFKALRRLFNALNVADMIYIAFHKTPEEVRLEAIKQEERLRA
ncbi:MAG: hypothetical protein LBF49_02120 [Puniceicoccales bacterium]|nr:hypothetical protein [Puniceicoccales bacterium]